MSKFNTSNTIKTVNRSGYPAYSMKDKEHLVTAVLTTMFGEPKFYGSTDNEIIRLATKCAIGDPEFLCKLACYARNAGNMRSVSHVLTAVIAREAREYTRAAIRNVVVRPDDITEIMSCYMTLYGKPFPNAMKREIASVIQQFDEYQLAKYNGGNKALKLRDVLRITHPVPKDEATEALFGKILSDTLETPYTWEVELSTRGNTKEVWNELISSGKVGYMALLRNLRNIVKAKANLEPVLRTLSDPAQVRRSRQLPFRFYSAYRTLSAENLMTDEIHQALEAAIRASIANMDQIPGRTLIAVDTSGSMRNSISSKSEVRCCDIAALLGAMAQHLCEDSVVCYFDAAWNSSSGYCIASYDKDDSILDICLHNPFLGGGTDLSLPMKYAMQLQTQPQEQPHDKPAAFDSTKVARLLEYLRALESAGFGNIDDLFNIVKPSDWPDLPLSAFLEQEEKSTAPAKPFDRIIYFSDNECNSSWRGLAQTVQGTVDEYRRKYNPDFWVHGVDLQGYGSQQFCGSKFNLIAGWSETVLPFILLAEKGVSTLVDTIAAYPVK